MKTNDMITKKAKGFVKNALLIGIKGAIFSAPALAKYPERPISLIIPYDAGGAADISARSLIQAISSEAPKPIMMSNRTGAGGVTGSAIVAHAKGDGYNMLAARVGTHTVSPAMKDNLPYSLEDFKFAGIYEINPVVCAASKKSGINSMEELIAAVKSQPGTISYSSSGIGTLIQLSAVMVLNSFGIKNPIEEAIHLPMRGGRGAATALLNGTATFICTNSSTLAGFIENDLMVPLLVTSKERLPGINAPTATELGHPELEQLVGWTGIAGPKSLNKEAQDAWSEWLTIATNNPEFVSRMNALGSIIVNYGPKEAEEFINNQYETFRTLVDKLNIRVE